MLQHVGMTLRLHYRNRMALTYGYIFPTVFLVAFWVLYRYENPPIARHLGELLTVTALAGACFGLPTAMVSERERGVWRRYRLTPASGWSLAASTLIARYVLLVTAALVQVMLAMLIGMPLPAHPFDLWLAFTFVSFAMLGLGLVIAMMADNVPAVQALGQCIFLPMLMIGGIAVRLERLPEWARHVSAFFPGRYAVEAIQAMVTEEGLGGARFPMLALLLIGGAAIFSGAKLFRWDSRQRFRARGGKSWLAVALAGWLAVGILAESTGFLERAGLTATAARDGGDVDLTAIVRNAETASPNAAIVAPPAPDAPLPDTARDSRDGSVGVSTPPPGDAGSARQATVPVQPTSAGSAPPVTAPPLEAWQLVTMAEIEANIDFTNLPPDVGRVTPIASGDYEAIAETECIRTEFPFWGPANVADPVQRVRNYLYVAAVPDMLQMDRIEGIVPHIVFERMQRELSMEELTRILYWIAIHPYEGDSAAADMLRSICLDTDAPGDPRELRDRSAMYAVKFIGRLMGKTPVR